MSLGELLICFVILTQAQRDYFGAHTYQRLDREGTFHTQWES
jgi:6-phosphogluconate dehydrogenase